MKQALALIAVIGAGAAFAAPAMAQAPDVSRLVALSAKADTLKSATGPAQIEAAMATCLLLGSDAEVTQMMLSEAGWERHEASDDFMAFYTPPHGPDDLSIDLGIEADTCGVTSNSVGVVDAQQMVKGLIGTLEPRFNTVTEGSGDDICEKHNLAMHGVEPGRIYVTVLDFSQEDPSCLKTATSSMTTFSFQPH